MGAADLSTNQNLTTVKVYCQGFKDNDAVVILNAVKDNPNSSLSQFRLQLAKNEPLGPRSQKLVSEIRDTHQGLRKLNAEFECYEQWEICCAIINSCSPP